MEKLAMICCLKNTGMSLQEIAQFTALAREGDSTLQARCEMLKKHRESVLERMEEMQRYLDKVTRKYDFYSKRLKEYEQQQKSLQNS